MDLVRIDNASVLFRPAHEHLLLRQHLANLFRQRKQGMFHALRGVTFSARNGEGVAVLGQNGAGKSTLLSLIAGVLPPSEGTVEVHGRVGALLELGAGFHPDLTGRENLVLNAALMGLNRKQVEERAAQMIEFSEIGEFIDDLLRNYSSGMRLRLAFAVAAHVDPQIVLIDEVLAVGDAAFAKKCVRRIREMREEGRLLICVSHATASLEGLCERAIWLHRGELVMDGPLREVSEAYAAFMADPQRSFRVTAAPQR